MSTQGTNMPIERELNVTPPTKGYSRTHNERHFYGRGKLLSGVFETV